MNSSTKSPGKKSGWLLGSIQLMLVCIVVVGAYAGAQVLKNQQPERATVEAQQIIPTVNTFNVEPSAQAITLTASGTVEAQMYINLTAPISGTIVSTPNGHGNGASFEAGDVLFSIDSSALEFERRQLAAEMRSKQSIVQIEQAKSKAAQRDWASLNGGKISDMAARGPHIRQAKADYEAIKAKHDAVVYNLERADYSLPFIGRVVESSIAVGQYVEANQTYGKS